jgi:hypothetical protein
MEKYYTESRRKGISCMKKGRKANGIGHNLRRNCLVAHVIEGQKK